MTRFTDRDLEIADLQRKEEIEEPPREVDRTARDIDGARIRVAPAQLEHRLGLVVVKDAYAHHYLFPAAARAFAQALIKAAQRAEEDGAE